MTDIGIVPYFIEEGVMKIMVLDVDHVYHIARRTPHKNESGESCALREGVEEFGMFEPNCKPFRNMGNYGGLKIYMTEIIDVDRFGDGSDSRWVTLEEFAIAGRLSQRHIVKQLFEDLSVLA